MFDSNRATVQAQVDARAVEAVTRERKQRCRKANSDFLLGGYVNSAYNELAHYLARDLASKDLFSHRCLC